MGTVDKFHRHRLSSTRWSHRRQRIHGATVTFDAAGPLADAAWAKQRLGCATQALPNGYFGLPVQQSCPHANACLTCPMFLTTSEFPASSPASAAAAAGHGR